MNLTAEQAAAVESTAAITTIVAPAGSGKTAVLVARVIHLVDSGVQSRDILCLVFSRHAAEEIRTRLRSAGVLECNVQTFHAHAASIIMGANDSIRSLNSQSIADPRTAELALRSLYSGEWEDCHERFGPARPPREQRGCTLSALKRAVRDHEARGVGDPDGMANVLRRRLEEHGLVPYWQLVPAALEIIHEARHYKHVLVDEWQDTTRNEQWLAVDPGYGHENGGTMFVVGDPRQAIFGWRGADQWGPLGETFHLTQSFRFGSTIAGYVNTLAAGDGMPRTVGCAENPGIVFDRQPVNVFDEDLPYYVRSAMATMAKTAAVLCRTNYECQLAHRALTRAGIAAQLVTRDPEDQLADDASASLRVMTVHAAKGLEFDVVVVLTNPQWPGQEPTAEEQRVHYVACTRAKLVLMRLEMQV